MPVVTNGGETGIEESGVVVSSCRWCSGGLDDSNSCIFVIITGGVDEVHVP